MTFSKLALLGGASVLLTGCGNLMSIHHDDSLLTPGGHVMTMDAKQRAIISNRITRHDINGVKIKIYRRYCSEPAPDALTALSVGTSGDLGLAGLKSADPELKLRAAIAMSETTATIERTQTVNVLREEMFRTCERYLNGSIGEEEFMIQAARDQRLIVSVLAIEQLTRAARPPATIIRSGGSSATYNDPLSLYEAQRRAKIASDASAEGLTGAKKALDEAQKQITDDWKSCTKENAAESEPADATQKKAYAQCKQLLSKLDEAQSQSEQDQKVLADLNTALTRQAYGLGANAGVGAGSDIRTEQVSGPSSADLATVASNVTEIVKAAYDFDEVTMTCVVRLRAMTDRDYPDKAALPAHAQIASDQFDQQCLNLVEGIAKQKISEAELAKAKADFTAKNLK